MPTRTRPKPPWPPARRVPYKDRTLEAQWLGKHRAEYAGEWVAVYDDRLIAHDADPDRFFAALKASGVKDALLEHIPEALPEGESFWMGWA